jgi:hypothetical protein
MKWINTRLPKQVYEQVLSAATMDRRPLSSWVRIAVEEKLARDSKKAGKK